MDQFEKHKQNIKIKNPKSIKFSYPFLNLGFSKEMLTI